MAVAAALFLTSATAAAQCPEEPALQHFTGSGSIVCPCFGVGEEAGAVFTIPAEHYPIEVLRVGIGWGSLYGGNIPQSEQAISYMGIASLLLFFGIGFGSGQRLISIFDGLTKCVHGQPGAVQMILGQPS